MHLIIGGAYQGKRAYAKERFGVREEEIFTCTEESGIVFGAPCIDRLEEVTLWCVRQGQDAGDIFRAHRAEWADSVLICADIFCGVVPIDPTERAWREEAGRFYGRISARAEKVFRMFCGLSLELK